MNTWEQLLLTGEFAPREHILGGLTLEQVGARPAGAPHSIYEELFHVARWQRSMLASARGGEPIPPDPDWPANPAPPDENSWTGLVGDFLAGSEEAVVLGNQTKRHDDVLPEGRTVRERLEHLTVHSVYHLGKIVLLRQLLGIWSPPPDDA